jgi:Putative transposase DNA-binding domain/MerR family regulatory protein
VYYSPIENTINISKAAKLLGVSVKTVQRWDREKRLIPIARTNTNRRLYTTSQIYSFVGLQERKGKEPTRIVTYCRVSRAAQKPDLVNQRRVLEKFIIADRFYPSSKLCSFCGFKNESLTLKDREWTCEDCGSLHDRDKNAALNLKQLATVTALPRAS